ncbi:nuclear transport factor 2 family protein [Thioclava sp. GXIMD4216]|uniref:nuclear transport factor 2 family protein n=1 Tax=Thioclava sp. GXIMD4216 TaxID=3131929 RepID=UPI0030CB28BD
MARLSHDTALAQALLAFEARRCNALVSADAAELHALLHPDLVHVHSTGMVHDKAAFMAHVARMGGFVEIERGEIELRQTGKDAAAGAIISGPTRNRVRRLDTGKTVDLIGFSTVVATLGEEGWQVLLSQLTLTG